MAIALPNAFNERALWFAAAYVLVRTIGLLLYLWVSWVDPSQRAAVRTFSLVSLGGLAAVLVGGLAGGTALYGLWGLAILLDVVAATVGARSEGWNLHPEHFAERHGFFVIIALGETLIVAAGGVTAAPWTGDLIAIAVLAVAVTCGLWWSYYPRAKPVLEREVAARRGAEQSTMARDVFSLVHFPMLCGVIAYAFAIEEATAHPSEPLPFEVRLALALGLALFVGGLVVAVWRATKRILLPRVVLTVVTVCAVMAVANVAPWVTLSLSLAGVVLVTLSEQLGDGPLAEAVN